MSEDVAWWGSQMATTNFSGSCIYALTRQPADDYHIWFITLFLVRGLFILLQLRYLFRLLCLTQPFIICIPVCKSLYVPV